MAGSRTRRILSAAALLALASAAGPAIEATAEFRPVQTPTAATRAVAKRHGELPAAFDANEGQFDDVVRFVAHAGAVTAGFFDGAAVLNLRGGDALCMRFGGAAPAPERRSGSRSSYFLGNDPARWRPDVASFERLVCRGVAPGVDLVWRGTQRALEYDLIVAPGADPSAATIGFDAASAEVDPATGDLVLVTAGGSEVRHSRPRCFQMIGSARRDVDAAFVVEGTSARIRIGDYDRARELVIDPTITQCTYFGGNQIDRGSGLAFGPSGDVYICGATGSANFPLVNAYQTSLRGGDLFVTRLLPDMSGIVFSTYVGGSDSTESSASIAVDGQGDAYVAGNSWSSDFPLVKAIQTYPGAGGNKANGIAFKLVASGGSLAYSTYVGGSGVDIVVGGALASTGAFVVCGSTSSLDLPVVNPRQVFHGGGTYDGFIAEIAPSGSAYAYATYHGGSGNDYISDCAVDATGAVFVVGGTASSNLPLANAMQTASGPAFLAKYNATGSALVFGTYVGNTSLAPSAMALDTSGRVYVTGLASAADFPSAGGSPPPSTGQGLFFARFDSNASALGYSYFLATSTLNPLPQFFRMAVDSGGGVVAVGSTGSTGLLQPVRAIQTAYGGGPNDGIFARLTGSPPSTLYESYFGGPDSGGDVCRGVALDGQGDAWIVGETAWSSMPVASAYQPALAGSVDAFVLRVSPLPPPPPFGLAAALEGDLAARLTWYDASTDETGFEIQRKINAGAYTPYASVPAGTTTYLDERVFSNVSYTYRVRAVGVEGPSAFSNEASVQRIGGTAIPPLPLAPDQLHALVVTPTEVALDWRDRSNDEIAFDVQRADGSGEYVSIGPAPQDFPAFEDTDVPPGWPVAYRVRALAPQGPSGFSNPALVTTPATLTLTTTRGVVADSAQPGRDRVEWKASIVADEDAVLDPRATGLRLQAGPRDAPLLLTIPPDDPRWRSHRKRFTWTSPKGALARFQVVVDARRRTVSVTATKFDFASLLDRPMRLLVAIGSEGGAVSETWVPGRKSGWLVPAGD